MDFLTKRTQFYCVTSPAVLFTVSESNKVTHKNSTVLTTSTTLTGNGICSNVMGPCQFQQTDWLNSDLTRKVDGKNILTDKSFCICPVGSAVKVRAALSSGFKSGNFSAQNAPTIAALPPLDNKQDVTVKSSPEISAPATNLKSPAESKQENEKFAAKNIDTKKVNENSNYILKCLTCTKKDCKYRCEKFKEFSTVVEGDSAKLKNNYNTYLKNTSEENLNSADKAYINSVALKGGWGYGAHHIISSKQAFAKVPDLVKVAQACGYDINCAENCIMLPSREKGHGKLDDEGKTDSAFSIMALTNMQCHNGSHDYSTNDKALEKLIHNHIGRRVKIKNYPELVIEDLARIKFPTEGEICPKEIIASINKISAKIRAKLAAFKENPKASYPYYVSKVAYAYAFKASLFKRIVATGRGGLKLIGRRLTIKNK